ncbi:MAG: hypothetical protein KGL39_45995, partial [Patescibacteria group bacterium]|nr:hypothetical protein [Patescibacteria group bacterium]
MKTKEKKPTSEQIQREWKTRVIKQYLQEKMYAVKLRQVKINTWNKIEEAYNGAVQKTLISRSNLHVPFVFKGIQDASAKIGSVPTIDFHPTPEGDRNAAPLMKHTVKDDLDSSNFEQIWADSKIEAGIYGRTFYEVIPGNDRQRVELCDSL